MFTAIINNLHTANNLVLSTTIRFRFFINKLWHHRLVRRNLVVVFTIFLGLTTLLIGIFLPYTNTDNRSKAASLDINTTTDQRQPKTMKVLEIRYFSDPHDIPHHPDELSQQLRKLISKASTYKGHSYTTHIPLIDIVVVDVFNRVGNRPNPDGNWETTYKEILAQDNICNVIRDKDVDQVWLWVDPRNNRDTGPGQEYAISSKYLSYSKGTGQYATLPSTPFCDGTPFVFMGFDYSRTADFALHSFGHMMEGLITNVQSVDLFWCKFAGVKAGDVSQSCSSLLTHNCGNVHYPPNGITYYDYANPSLVTDNVCQHWTPEGSNTKDRFNCSRWNCNQSDYLVWWMQNMPGYQSNIVYEGKLIPPWFEFTVDMDQTIAGYLSDNSYFMNKNLETPKLPASIGSVTSTKGNGSLFKLTHNISNEGVLLLLLASYRSPSKGSNPGEAIASVTTNLNQNNTGFAHVRRDLHHEYATEIWYSNSPSIGDHSISVSFTHQIEDAILSLVAVKDADPSNPIFQDHDAITKGAGTGQATFDQSQPGLMRIETAAPENNLLIGVLSTYTAGNTLSLRPGSTTIFSDTTTNVISQVSLSSNSNRLEWTSTVNWPWSLSAVSINPRASTPSPSSTPKPSSTPTPSVTPQPTAVIVSPTPYTRPSINPSATPVPLPSPSTAPITIINRFPLILTASLPRAKVNQTYTTTVSGYDVNRDDKLYMTASNLPGGLTLSNCVTTKQTTRARINCRISGRPTTAATYPVTFILKDSQGAISTKTLSLRVVK